MKDLLIYAADADAQGFMRSLLKGLRLLACGRSPLMSKDIHSEMQVWCRVAQNWFA